MTYSTNYTAGKPINLSFHTYLCPNSKTYDGFATCCQSHKIGLKYSHFPLKMEEFIFIERCALDFIYSILIHIDVIYVFHFV